MDTTTLFDPVEDLDKAVAYKACAVPCLKQWGVVRGILQCSPVLEEMRFASQLPQDFEKLLSDLNSVQ